MQPFQELVLALVQQLVLALVQEPALLFCRKQRGKRLQPELPKRASCSFESPLMEKHREKTIRISQILALDAPTLHNLHLNYNEMCRIPGQTRIVSLKKV